MTCENVFRQLLPAACTGMWIIAAGHAAPSYTQTYPNLYPNRAVRIVVPLAPGGAVDGVARIIAGPLSEALHQSVVVDNRAGGATNIGTEIVAKSPPDGYTLLLTNSSAAANVSLYPRLPYDFRKDITPISLIATTPLVLIAHPSLPVKSVRDLIALAKSHPGQLAFGSAGISSPAHICGELLNLMAGTRMLHVPYKGGGPMLTDLLGGQIMIAFSGLLTAPQFEKSGKLRVLGHTGARRIASIPDMPTIAEGGVPGYELVGYFALFTTGGTAPDVVARLHNELVRALAIPEIHKRIADSGAEVTGSTPKELGVFVAKEIEKYAKLIHVAHIRPE